jgi:hypothetical protein
MARESSYQKLKRQLAQAHSDLRELAARPSSERSILIKMCEIFQEKQEEMFWNGNPNDANNKTFTGFIKSPIN